jgi:hypothetical protein
MHKRDLERCFDNNLQPLGFKKKASSWYLEQEDTLVLVDLQKSNFGDQFYTNVAAWLKVLGRNVFPKEHQCHIRIRLGAAYPELKAPADKLLNLEDLSLTDAQRSDGINQLFINGIIPLTTLFKDVDSAKNALHSSILSGALVTKRAQELLGT